VKDVASLGNIVLVAGQLLDRMGKGAPEILDRRAAAHLEEGDEETARYWARVAKSQRYILSQDRAYFGAGRGARPFELPARMIRAVFQNIPQPSILLQPNMVIVGVNRAYLATMDMDGADIVGCDLFDVFPDNPSANANSTGTLAESFGRVLEACCPDHLDHLRYDVRNRDGLFEERWWSPVNTPVTDDDGRLELIIHQAFEVPKESVRLGG
jgi:PAS domain-containing protein